MIVSLILIYDPFKLSAFPEIHTIEKRCYSLCDTNKNCMLFLLWCDSAEGFQPADPFWSGVFLQNDSVLLNGMMLLLVGQEQEKWQRVTSPVVLPQLMGWYDATWGM